MVTAYYTRPCSMDIERFLSMFPTTMRGWLLVTFSMETTAVVLPRCVAGSWNSNLNTDRSEVRTILNTDRTEVLKTNTLEQCVETTMC